MFGLKNLNPNPCSDHLINVGKIIQISACYWWNSESLFKRFFSEGGKTLKKTKGVFCAYISCNSVAVALRFSENVNIHWSPLKKAENLINIIIQFYNILECFFLGKILHFSTFEKNSPSFTVHYKQSTSQAILCQQCWCAAVYNTIKVNGREQNAIQLL